LKHLPWESKASALWRGLLAVAEEIPALRNVDLVRLDQRTDDQRVEIIELRLREDFVTELKRAGIQLLAEIRTVILPSGSLSCMQIGQTPDRKDYRAAQNGRVHQGTIGNA
jgi:hypothetical protein